MDIEESLLRVQRAYPRIYLACHSRRQNARTTSEKLSQGDATLLAHLDERGLAVRETDGLELIARATEEMR